MTNANATTDKSSSSDWRMLAEKVGRSHQANVAGCDQTGEIAVGLFEELRDCGITSALVPEEFGGGGATHEQMGLMLRELGRWDPASAVTLAMHSHVLGAQVWRHRHGMDAEKVFRKVVDDRVILVSTGASDWLSSNGTVERTDGGYLVSARKGPSSGCEVGDLFATSFRIDSPEGPKVFHCTLPSNAEGISIEHTWDTLGMRATGSHTIKFEKVFVPDAAISMTRDADVWHPFYNTIVGVALPLIMSAYAGSADAAVEIAVGAGSRRQDSAIISLIGEMLNARTVADDAITAMFVSADNFSFENTDQLAAQTLSRKTTAADALIQTIRLAIEVTGGAGYSRSSDLERLYRDVHGSIFHPLPRHKQTQFTGRVALGLSPVG